MEKNMVQVTRNQVIQNLEKVFNRQVNNKLKVGMSVVHYPEKIRFKWIKKHFMYQEPAIHGFCPLIEDMEQKTMEIVIPLSLLR